MLPDAAISRRRTYDHYYRRDACIVCFLIPRAPTTTMARSSGHVGAAMPTIDICCCAISHWSEARACSFLTTQITAMRAHYFTARHAGKMHERADFIYAVRHDARRDEVGIGARRHEKPSTSFFVRSDIRQHRRARAGFPPAAYRPISPIPSRFQPATGARADNNRHGLYRRHARRRSQQSPPPASTYMPHTETRAPLRPPPPARSFKFEIMSIPPPAFRRF